MPPILSQVMALFHTLAVAVPTVISGVLLFLLHRKQAQYQKALTDSLQEKYQAEDQKLEDKISLDDERVKTDDQKRQDAKSRLDALLVPIDPGKK